MADRFDIYFGAWPWGGTDYRRWWLLVQLYPNEGSVGCFPISTKDYKPPHFEISSEHPDFAATGLKETSYVHDEHVIKIPLTRFEKRTGDLRGSLKEAFIKSSGIPA
jgi:hypothetical protein